MKDLLQTYFFQGFLCKCGVICEYEKRFPFEIPGFASLWISMATCSSLVSCVVLIAIHGYYIYIYICMYVM